MGKGVASGRLAASTDPAAAKGARAVLITVGTPLSDDYTADLAHIRAACASVAPYLHDGQIVMIKSTVPPGTTRAMHAEIIAPALPAGARVHMAFSPERLAEGAAIRELSSIPILVGGVDAAAGEAAAAFWREALPVEVMTVASPEAAEMVKLADNLWIDLNIALANELAKLVDAMPWKIDVMEVIRGANSLKKGQHHVNILHPANGVGGYCLTKDPWFVDALGRRAGIELQIPRASRAVNDSMPGHVFDRVMGALAERGIGARGRPDRAARLLLQEQLRRLPLHPGGAAGGQAPRRRLQPAHLRPHGHRGRGGAPRRRAGARLGKAVAGADAVLILAGHDAFTGITAEDFARLAPGALIYDGRIYYPPGKIAELRGRRPRLHGRRALGQFHEGHEYGEEFRGGDGDRRGRLRGELPHRAAAGARLHGARPRHRAAGERAQPRGGEGPSGASTTCRATSATGTTIEAFFRPEAAVLYHLASVVGVRRYMEDPLSLIDIAIIGTRQLIALAVEHDVRILFTSTSEVYGRNPAVPWKEDDDRVLGATSVDRWSYAASKGVCEQMLYGVHRKTGLPFSIVRFFNVYGPRQTPIYVVSQTVQRVLNGVRPDLYDGGGQTRCLTYVEDAIEGVIAAATRPEAVGEVFNIGNATENSMAEVVRDGARRRRLGPRARPGRHPREVRRGLRGHRPARAGGGEGRAHPRLEGHHLRAGGHREDGGLGARDALVPGAEAVSGGRPCGSRFSERATSASCRARCWPRSATTCSASTWTRPRSRG